MAGAATTLAVPNEHSPYQNLSILARALAHIEMSWVGDTDQDGLIYGAIKGMVSTLDPSFGLHDAPGVSGFLTSDTEGQFGGIGVEIEVQDGWLTILGVYDGGPASRVGLKPGDRFLVIENRDARDMRIQDAVRLMRGEPGTPVRVQVSTRRSTPRDRAHDGAGGGSRWMRWRLACFPAASLTSGSRAFQETATTELRRALDLAVAETANAGGLRGILLDLRSNPGGLLEEAILVSDEFLGEGVIVSTRGRGGQLLSESRASRAGHSAPVADGRARQRLLRECGGDRGWRPSRS